MAARRNSSGIRGFAVRIFPWTAGGVRASRRTGALRDVNVSNAVSRPDGSRASALVFSTLFSAASVKLRRGVNGPSPAPPTAVSS